MLKDVDIAELLDYANRDIKEDESEWRNRLALVYLRQGISKRSVAASHVRESRYPFLSQDSHFCPFGVPHFQALASPIIRVSAYVVRDAKTRPLGISPAYMENREEYLLQSKGLEHVRAALSTVNCRLIVQHVAMSTPYLRNGLLVPAAVAGEAQCQACNP